MASGEHSMALTRRELGFVIGMAPLTMLYATLGLASLMFRAKQSYWPPLGVSLPAFELPAAVGLLSLAVLVFLWFSRETQSKFYLKEALMCALLAVAVCVVSLFILARQGEGLGSNVATALFHLSSAVNVLFLSLGSWLLFKKLRSPESLELSVLRLYWTFLLCLGTALMATLYV